VAAYIHVILTFEKARNSSTIQVWFLENMKRYLPVAIIIVVFLIAIGAGALLFRVKQQRIAAAKLAAEAAAAKASLGAEPAHVRGAADAPVTLEEFGDFECRPCGDFSPILEKIEQDYGSRLRVIFRQCPLAVHKHALEAARASEAAGLQGRFWEMHDLLYHNRFIWPFVPDVRKAFDDYAKSLGLDLERFKKDMDGEPVKTRIAADQRRAKSLGVDRTPTLFINNRLVPVTSLTPPGLHDMIDAELNRKVQ
jgi:protein-disulfide isomerase